jgi:hypothetical protein
MRCMPQKLPDAIWSGLPLNRRFFAAAKTLQHPLKSIALKSLLEDPKKDETCASAIVKLAQTTPL